MRKYSDQKIHLKKRPVLRYILCLIFCILGVGQMFILNSLSTKGKELTETELAIDSIAKENELLEVQVASVSAMTTIYKRAEKIGLVKTPQTLSLNAPIPEGKIVKIFN